MQDPFCLFDHSISASGCCEEFMVQSSAPAAIPADHSEVYCCVDQWPPDVSVLAKVDSHPA